MNAWVVWFAMFPGVSQGDLARFPSRDAVIFSREFNRSFISNLSLQQSLQLHHWWEYDERIKAANGAYAAWDALDDAHLAQSRFDLAYHLDKLRKVIGDEAYYSGRMPPPVPLCAFREIDE